MNTSHNHLRCREFEESAFLRAKGYLHDLSKPEKDVLLENLGLETGAITVVNHPDNEDLMQKQEGGQLVLKFKDKKFDRCKFSGLGRVYLRKNEIGREGNKKNVLEQEAFLDSFGNPLVNTIFIIQYDFDLDGGFIEIPKNSVLLFEGGHLKNGTVIFQNTLVLPLGLDIERNISTVIRGTYAEGSIVYLRKKIRYFDGECWRVLGAPELPPHGMPPFDPKHIDEYIRKQIDAILDFILPFQIEFYSEKREIVEGSQSITLNWKYNRPIQSQKISMFSTNDDRDIPLDHKTRTYTFTNVNTVEDVKFQLDCVYKGKVKSETLVLHPMSDDDNRLGITGVLNGIKFEKGIAIGKA